MILASSSSGLAGFLIISGLIGLVLSLWIFVLTVRFLSSGRRAFERYLFMTSDPIRPAKPVTPAENIRRGTGHARKNYGP